MRNLARILIISNVNYLRIEFSPSWYDRVLLHDFVLKMNSPRALTGTKKPVKAKKNSPSTKLISTVESKSDDFIAFDLDEPSTAISTKLDDGDPPSNDVISLLRSIPEFDENAVRQRFVQPLLKDMENNSGESSVELIDSSQFKIAPNYLPQDFFDKNPIIKKSISMLMMVPRSGRLDDRKMKCWDALVANAQRKSGYDIFSVRLADILPSVFKTSRHDYPAIKATLNSLVGTIVSWERDGGPPKGDGEFYKATSLCSEVTLAKIKNEIVIYYGFSLMMRDEIFNPERYTKINLTIQTALGNRIASIRLYSICCQYLAFKKTVSFEWEIWRGILMGYEQGTDPGVYAEWKYFNRDIISKAVNDINQMTDIHIELITLRRGRSVTKISFSVTPKNGNIDSTGSADYIVSDVDLPTIEKGLKIGLKSDHLYETLKRYGPIRTAKGLKAMTKRLGRKDLVAVDNHAKYFDSVMLRVEDDANQESMEDDAGSLVVEFEKIDRTPPDDENNKIPSNIKTSQGMLEQANYLKFRRNMAYNEYKIFSTSDKHIYEKEFKEYIDICGYSTKKNALERYGIESKLLIEDFKHFIAHKLYGMYWNKGTVRQLEIMARQIQSQRIRENMNGS